MKHAVILLWHKDFAQLIELIRFFDNDFSFYIHADRKSRLSDEELTTLSSLENVALVTSRYKVNWGGFNILKAELLLLRSIVKDGRYDYVHLMSGQDYPIKPLVQIKKFFEDNNGTEFIEHHSYPFKEWKNSTYTRVERYHFYDWFDYRTEAGLSAISRFAKIQKMLHIKRCIPNQYQHLYGGSTWFSMTG